MNITLSLFVTMLFLSLPGGFVLKLCSYTHLSPISRFVNSRIVLTINLICGWPLLVISVVATLWNAYFIILTTLSGKLDSVWNLGWVFILFYPLVGMWLGRKMVRLYKGGC